MDVNADGFVDVMREERVYLNSGQEPFFHEARYLDLSGPLWPSPTAIAPATPLATDCMSASTTSFTPRMDVAIDSAGVLSPSSDTVISMEDWIRRHALPRRQRRRRHGRGDLGPLAARRR